MDKMWLTLKRVNIGTPPLGTWWYENVLFMRCLMSHTFYWSYDQRTWWTGLHFKSAEWLSLPDYETDKWYILSQICAMHSLPFEDRKWHDMRLAFDNKMFNPLTSCCAWQNICKWGHFLEWCPLAPTNCWWKAKKYIRVVQNSSYAMWLTSCWKLEDMMRLPWKSCKSADMLSKGKDVMNSCLENVQFSYMLLVIEKVIRWLLDDKTPLRMLTFCYYIMRLFF